MADLLRTKVGMTTTLTESYVAVGTLILPTDPQFNFEDVELVNEGDTDLRVAVGAASDANSRTLAAGESLFLAKANLNYTWVKTVDDTGNNILEFVGTPI